MSEIDWEEQWETFAENYYDGLAHVNLEKYGKAIKSTLLLCPGPGFGDLSHPTTQLMLEMMQGRVENQNILDIGSGSGILSLTAKLLKARKVIGVDISKEAVIHARKNALINDLESSVQFSETIPEKLPKSQILLMNMIFSEQREVMKNREKLRAKTWIFSGILEEQLTPYILALRSWHLEPLEVILKDGWVGLICSPS